jgi:hypothetical protein
MHQDDNGKIWVSVDTRDHGVLVKCAMSLRIDPDVFIAGIISDAANRMSLHADRRNLQAEILSVMKTKLAEMPNLVAVLSRSMAEMDGTAGALADIIISGK